MDEQTSASSTRNPPFLRFAASGPRSRDITWPTATTAPFQLADFSVAPGQQTASDTHAVRELWIIMEGSGVLRHQGQEYAIAAGDAVFFESFETHQLANTGPQELRVQSIWW